MDPDESEGALLRRIRSGEPDALGDLFDRHAGYVLALAIRMLGDRSEAEDVVQDVFWKLWKGSVSWDPDRGRFRTWLFAIVRNRCLDLLRRDARRRPPATQELAALVGSESPHLAAEEAETRRRVESALAALAEGQRRAIELAYFGGLSHREIADRIGSPLGTVKSDIRRGLERLRGALETSASPLPDLRRGEP